MKMLLILLCWLFTYKAGATNYYISTSGNDQHTGTTPNDAWATLSKIEAEASHFSPGDQILFKRGDIFYGQLRLQNLKGNTSNHITFGAYGSGANPVLDGTVPITDWQQHKGNIWVAKAQNFNASLPLNGVYLDNKLINKGRYPNPDDTNKGFLTIDQSKGFNDKNSLEDKELAGKFPDNYWQGAEIVVRTRNYLLDIATVLSHQAGRIQTTDLTYGVQQGFGYFFQNSLQALDQNREWYYDSKTKELYLYFTEGNPNAHDIRLAVQNSVFALSLASYISVQDLTFQRGLGSNVTLNHVDHSIFNQNEILHAAGNGLVINQADFLTLEGNLINHTQNNALELKAVNNSV